jgi:hypothetical protein
MLLVAAFLNKSDTKSLVDILISFIVGIIFTLGLGFSGMLRRSKIMGFLTLNSNWDPTLLFVLGAAVGGNIATFHYILNIKKTPILAEKMSVPTNK